VLPPDGAAATTPGAPTITTATLGNQSVKLDFNAPAEDGGAVITGYTATCASSGKPTRTASVNGATTSINVGSLVNGAQYSCTVHATNSEGNGSESGAYPVTPRTTAAAPTGVVTASTGKIGELSVTFTATPPTSNGGAPVTGYNSTCTATGQVAKSATGTKSPIVVKGMTNGKAYTCKVQAQNAAGLGPSSTGSSASPGAPSAPSSVTVAKGTTNGSLKVTVGAATVPAGAPVNGFTVTCTAPGSTKTVNATTQPVNVTALVRTKTYVCKAASKNKFGAGPFKTKTPGTVPK
jgi:titin